MLKALLGSQAIVIPSAGAERQHLKYGMACDSELAHLKVSVIHGRPCTQGTKPCHQANAWIAAV